MAHWLVKSEPAKYSWDRMAADGTTAWDGVRNHQAANNLRAMRVGDRAFFYHSNEGLAVVGVVAVAREHYPDPTDPSGRFVAVDMQALFPVKAPVTLSVMKADPILKDMALIRQSRLSVCPVTGEEWTRICELAGVPV